MAKGRPWYLIASGLMSPSGLRIRCCGRQQYPRIGYVYPAGGRQGTTFVVTVGGQFLGSWKGEYHIDVLDAHFSGEGVTAEVVKDPKPMREKEVNDCGRRHGALEKQTGRRGPQGNRRDQAEGDPLPESIESSSKPIRRSATP